MDCRDFAWNALAESRCGGCHEATPRLGATAPLVTWDDLRVNTRRSPEGPIYLTLKERMAVNAPSGLAMPPRGEWDDPTAEELRVVSEWVDQGGCQGGDMAAPRDTCPPSTMSSSNMMMGSSGFPVT